LSDTEQNAFFSPHIIQFIQLLQTIVLG